ncbi:MAG: tRNA lysidine(34) synthetase TilS [Verrucomicrobia bacterium]|nr:tRNA lysidine(34) synthetase TilS [Verrucomicrobiota bacterium]
MKPKRRAIDWPAVAAAFAQRIPHEKLHPGAMLAARADFLRARRKTKIRTPRWALAFSGGADSLALLLAFWAEGPGRWGRDFVVLHFNHRLRGRASEADEKFCAKVCAALGVKFVAGRWRDARKGASEAAARAARFEFFGRELRRRKIRLLWFGHQQDDIAETMLMRLARGSGARGLAAPRPAQAMPGGVWHLRPLLSLKKAEIVAALRAAGATWREDATNARGLFLRNRVRRSVVPAWTKAAARDALAGAARSRELLDEDDAALEAWLDEIAPLSARGALDLHRLAGRPRAIVRRALHRWLLRQPQAGELSRQAFEALLAAVERGAPTRHSLGREGFGVICDGVLSFERIGKRPVKLHRRAN